MKKHLFAGLLLFGFTAGAQNTDIPIYQFGQTTAPNGARISLYKTVYQGCEIFIAAAEGHLEGYAGGNFSSASIALGRGCK